MPTLIDYFNNFENRTAGSGLDSNSRSLYYALLAIFNRQQFPSYLRLSADYLVEAAGLKDAMAVNRAKNKLQARGFIKSKCNYYALTLQQSCNDSAKKTQPQYKKNESVKAAPKGRLEHNKGVDKVEVKVSVQADSSALEQWLQD